jgi:hypothetical protein
MFQSGSINAELLQRTCNLQTTEIGFYGGSVATKELKLLWLLELKGTEKRTAILTKEHPITAKN